MDEDEVWYIDPRNAVTVVGRSQNGRPVPVSGNGRSRSITPTVVRRSGGNGNGNYGGMSRREMMEAEMGFGAGAAGGSIANGALGRLTLGDIIELAVTAWVALSPLPSAPAPTADAVTDIENSITYQTALATYAKRDEQIRALGTLGKLLT